MKPLSTLFVLLLFASFPTYAQSWDGGGVTTDWNEAANWNPDGVPAAGASVTFNTNATVTGTSTAAPSFVTIDGAIVTFNMLPLNVSGSTDDGILVTNGGTLVNQGTINASTDGAGFNSHAVLLSDGTLHNESVFNASVTGNARAIRVGGGSTLNNSGSLLVSGGNTGQRIRNEGVVHNQNGGLLDLTDGRMNIGTGGQMTNDGLFKNTRGGAPIFFATPGTGSGATNNGFYDANGTPELFAVGGGSGTAGTRIDLGIDLNDPSETNLNAFGSCAVTIANSSYQWSDGDRFTGSSNSSGLLGFPVDVFSSIPVSLQTSIQGTVITIVVDNICEAALPVEWLDFSAVAWSSSVLLKWQTATELNNNYLAVERSQDGVTFRELGRVKGAGTTDFIQDYQWEDRRPHPGVNYYRLRQVDYDNRFSYSATVVVRFEKDASEVLKVFPTLIAQGSPLTIYSATASEIVLLNAQGQVLSRHKLRAGLQQFPTDQLPTGTYYLRSRANNELVTQRFLILN